MKRNIEMRYNTRYLTHTFVQCYILMHVCYVILMHVCYVILMPVQCYVILMPVCYVILMPVCYVILMPVCYIQEEQQKIEALEMELEGARSDFRVS